MIKNIHSIIITSKLNEVKKIYTEIFGFKVVFESDWYIQLQSGEHQIGFMLPGLENQPKEIQTEYSGKGTILTLEVENIEEYYRKIKSKLNLILELKTEEWGQTHFITQDPCGLIVDIVGYTKPEDYKQ